MINKVVIETDISCIPTIQGNERGGVHLPLRGACLTLWYRGVTLIEWTTFIRALAYIQGDTAYVKACTHACSFQAIIGICG